MDENDERQDNKITKKEDIPSSEDNVGHKNLTNKKSRRVSLSEIDDIINKVKNKKKEGVSHGENKEGTRRKEINSFLSKKKNIVSQKENKKKSETKPSNEGSKSKVMENEKESGIDKTDNEDKQDTCNKNVRVLYDSPEVKVIENTYFSGGNERKELQIIQTIKDQGSEGEHEKEKVFFSERINDFLITPSKDTEEKQEFSESTFHPIVEDIIEKATVNSGSLEEPSVRSFDLEETRSSGSIPTFAPVSPSETIADIQPEEMVTPEELEMPKEFHPGEREELKSYGLKEPFSYAKIMVDKSTYEKQYEVIEPNLSDEERKQLKFIKNTLVTGLGINFEELEEKGVEQYLEGRINEITEDYSLNLNQSSKEKILYYIKRDALDYGKIDPLMWDPNIEDISCDGPGVPVFLYHRDYGSLKTNVVFETEEELSSFVVKLAQKCGKHISIAEPILDATLPDGSRIQLTLSTEVTTKGSTFTIRKFRAEPFTPTDLIEFNTMSTEMLAYMWMAVENGASALFAGGTASGKTTTLNAISLFIPPEVKIVSIEETREINLPHSNWIPGLARSGFGEVIGDRLAGEIDMYDLMKAALRQRPEYILVGEVRGKEAYVLFQAMSTGHTTYSTVHADSPDSLIHRLEGKPLNVPRIMMQSLDIIAVQSLVKVTGKRQRRCKAIVELVGIDSKTKEILTNEVFRWIPDRDEFDYSGKSYVLERIRGNAGLTKDEISKELHIRSDILRWMKNKNIRSYQKFAQLVSRYYEDPKSVIYEMKGDMDVIHQ